MKDGSAAAVRYYHDQGVSCFDLDLVVTKDGAVMVRRPFGRCTEGCATWGCIDAASYLPKRDTTDKLYAEFLLDGIEGSPLNMPAL